MYWLRRPPYSRWIAAAAVLALGLFLDTRTIPLVPYPYATNPILVGESLAPHVEWRDIPAGILPEWDGTVTGVAIADVAAGTPIVPELAAEQALPKGWWAVSLPLPHRVAIGTPIRVALDTGIVEGFVAGEISDDGFEMTAPVAFAADAAASVAVAASASALVVIVGG